MYSHPLSRLQLNVADIPEKGFVNLTLNSADGGGATIRGIMGTVVRYEWGLLC